MLVLSRKKGESLIIGGDTNKVIVEVVEVRGDKVRLGIIAPKEVPVIVRRCTVRFTERRRQMREDVLHILETTRGNPELREKRLRALAESPTSKSIQPSMIDLTSHPHLEVVISSCGTKLWVNSDVCLLRAYSCGKITVRDDRIAFKDEEDQ